MYNQDLLDHTSEIQRDWIHFERKVQCCRTGGSGPGKQAPAAYLSQNQADQKLPEAHGNRFGLY